MPGKNFEIDDIVYAKWPGSTQYYKAVIMDIDSGRYQVKFDSDDMIDVVQRKHLMTQIEVETPKSPSRKRSRSRSASPGRRRSRSRSPSRRKPASPKETGSPVARQSRSPARGRRTTAKAESPKPKVESQKAVKVASISPKRVYSEKSVTVQKEESKQLNVEEINSREPITSRLTSARNNVVEQQTTTVTRRTTRSVTKALQEQQETKDEKSSSCSSSGSCTLASAACCTLKSLPCLVMSIIGMILPTVLLYGLYLSCTKRSCTMLKLPTIPPCEKFFNWKSTGYVFGWFIFQMVLSAIPVGKVVTGPVLADGKARQHCLNGLFQFAMSMATIGGLVFYGKLPFKYLTVNYLSLITAAAIYSFIVSIVVYFASRNASPKEPSNGFFSDFMKGRAASPRIGNFDIKMYAFKTGAVSWAAYNVCLLVREMSNGKDLTKTNPGFLLLVAFQIWYALDLLVFEESLLYTATLSKDKMGHFAFDMMFGITPFYGTLQTRYLVSHPVALPWYCFVIPIMLHVVGFYIYRTSLMQKFLFRKDFKKASELGVKSIPTKCGRNLLVDGFWGSLRHPNYTGDFMMNVSWGIICGVTHLLPWVAPIALFALLIQMATADDKGCAEKYGASWDEYRERVKYKFIPYIV